MERWETVIDFLLERGRLESVAADVDQSCDALLERATKRLVTARAAEAGEDWEGAFANAYDVYRMTAEVLLLRQGLRATGGDGSHVAVEMRWVLSSPAGSLDSQRCAVVGQCDGTTCLGSPASAG